MKPSNRISKGGTYYFADKLNELKKMQEAGNDILNLGVGSPDIAAPKLVIDTLKETASHKEASQYQPYNGIAALRIGFSDWYKRVFDVTLNYETEILPLLGSKEAVMHIHLAFCNPGDTILIPNPGYPAYAASAKLLGLTIVNYDLEESNNWMACIDQLQQKVTKNCKILWVNYPNMPTGAVVGKKELSDLVNFAKHNNLLLVNDNPYSMVLNKTPLSVHSCSGNYENVLELNSLSKSHNMSGWRVGFVSGSPINIKHILQVKSNFDSGMYKPIQLAATKALSLGEKWFNELNSEYKERAKIVYELLDFLKCTYTENQSGMFVWAKVNSNQLSGENLSNQLLYSTNIFVTPGFVFGSNGDQYIRISLCASQTQLKEALNRLKTTNR